MNRPPVSIVTVTRNRPELMLRCIHSLAGSAYTPLEWVIVENSDPQERARLLAQLEQVDTPIQFRLIESESDGFAALRQRGFDAASGALVVSIDDDCVAPTGMIEIVVARFEANEKLGILGGELINVGFSGAERFKGRGRIGVNGRYEAVEDSSEAQVFGSANQTLRREAFQRVGGYDLFFRDGMEEADLTLRIQRAGYQIGYEPSLQIEHHHHPSRHATAQRNLHRMRLYLFFKHWPPRGLSGWLGFAVSELGLWVQEGIHHFGSLARRIQANPERPWAVRVLAALRGIMRELFKGFSARLGIPSLHRAAQKALPRAGGEVAS